jgi:hypothetical protein
MIDGIQVFGGLGAACVIQMVRLLFLSPMNLSQHELTPH